MTFSSSDDIINVSDITDRVEELRSEREDNHSAIDEFQADNVAHLAHADDGNEHAKEYMEMLKAQEQWEEEEGKELAELESLLSDLCGYGGDHQWEGDWYPATLIAEDYFEKYMDEMLEDIGDIPKNLPSYLTITVDYDALKQDYSEVEFDGNTFYYR